jgi:hypothetical protein
MGDDMDDDMDFLGLSDPADDGPDGSAPGSSSAAGSDGAYGTSGGAAYGSTYEAAHDSWGEAASRQRRSRRRVDRPDAGTAAPTQGAESDEEHSDGPVDVSKVRDR